MNKKDLKMKKKFKKAKEKRYFLKEDIDYLKERVDNLERKRRMKKKNEMKIMRATITISFVIIAIASIYSMFFK